ncbi:MAG: carbon-nitrogen hydrolase family protein [Kiloniellales bacterium]|nr:carbon-nitrogen hydrolase family protein [Kiloniellales bacterium]
MKVTVVQMNTQEDKAANLASARALIETAASTDAPDLIVLPETFTSMTSDFDRQRANAETIPDGEACRLMSELARAHGVYIHAGSMAEAAGDKCYNTTTVWDREGALIARYRKIHLFDVDVPGGQSYRESDTMRAGNEVVTYDLDGVTVGCAVCYDLRFPELFRALRDKDATVIVLPAAFTLLTGKDHWTPLIKARAIETQTYMVASAQIFTHDDGRKPCYGHSMIVDPWGTVIAEASDNIGSVTARIDPDYVELVRGKMPVMQHHVLGDPATPTREFA